MAAAGGVITSLDGEDSFESALRSSAIRLWMKARSKSVSWVVSSQA